MKIAFLLPTNEIAGGILVVYKQAAYLASVGHDVSLVYEHYEEKWWDKYKINNRLTIVTDIDEIRSISFDLAIATWWKTAFTIIELINAKKYAYFVQSDERKFYDEEASVIDRANRHAVEFTYRLFPGAIITEAKWICKLFEKEFGRTAFLAPNGIDCSLFNTKGPQIEPLPKGHLRVLVEGPGNISFKRVEYTHMCLSQFYDDVEIWHVASDGVIRPYWKIDRCFSRVPYHDMPKIMRSCDLIVKLSVVEGFFGPPLEMFACGGSAVTSDVTGHDEFMVNGKNGFVVPMDDFHQTVKVLREIINKGRDYLKPLKRSAQQTAKEFDWSKQYRYFEEALTAAFLHNECGDKKKLQVIGRLYLTDPSYFLNLYADE